MSDRFKKQLEKMKVYNWTREPAVTHEQSADATIIYGVRSINDVLRAVRPAENSAAGSGVLTKASRK